MTKKKSKKQKKSPAANIQYIGEGEMPEAVSLVREIIYLPSNLPPSGKFYHEKAATIVNSCPSLFKHIVPDSK